MKQEANTAVAFAPEQASVLGCYTWGKQYCTSMFAETQEKQHPCFLSVVVRTQGNRRESLMETFLMLQGQTDQVFEVVLVVHKATDQGKACVREVLALFSEDFQNRIQVHFLEEGTRATPLNFGALHANGAYYVALDDDDLITDHWVQTFHEGAQAAPSCLIRSYALTQKWQTLQTKDGTTVLRSEGPHVKYFCTPFSITEMLREDITPIACVAIPTRVVQDWNFRYDETLNVCEDWDFLVRAILICGIYDTQQITFIYRLWNKSNGDSHALHPWEEWLETIERIKKKFAAYPIVMTYDTFEKRMANVVVSSVTGEAVHRPGFFERLRDFVERHGILLTPFAMIWRLLRYGATHLIGHPIPPHLIPQNMSTFERLHMAIRRYGLLLFPFVLLKKTLGYTLRHLFWRRKPKPEPKAEKEEAQSE